MKYITMRNLPAIGDTFSQLSQYVALLAIAKKNDKEIVFFKGLKGQWGGYKFNKVIDIDLKFVEVNDIDWTHRDVDKTNVWDPTLFSLEQDKNYIIYGGLSSHYYWSNMQEETINQFNFRKEVLNRAKEYIKSLSVKNTLISVHNRRGDYLIPPYNSGVVELNDDYYSKALKEFDHIKDYTLLVCTQDKDWFQSNVFKDKDNIIFVDSGDDFVDMCVMSLCEHNIIANSSFSFWSAVLNKNKNKIVVCPKNYIKSSHKVSRINGIYALPDWIQINNSDT